MDFEALNDYIPYVLKGKRHSAVLDVYDGDGWAIRVKQPGKYSEITQGGDFVVEIHSDAAGWDYHQFTHVDVFKDLELKASEEPEFMREHFSKFLFGVCEELDPNELPDILEEVHLSGVEPRALLAGMQTLCVAEHRRCPACEPIGGRWLPIRFAQGIIHGMWGAADAAGVSRRGKPGVFQLRKRYGREPARKDL